MFTDKKKIQKKTNKLCPDCGYPIEIVLHSKAINGVIYSDNYEECTECCYQELISNKRNRQNKIEE
jgi:uncharacterized protein with PIN domain